MNWNGVLSSRVWFIILLYIDWRNYY
jgi:hypothetical protein